MPKWRLYQKINNMQRWLEEILEPHKYIRRLQNDLKSKDERFKSLYKVYIKEMKKNTSTCMSALDFEGHEIVDSTIVVENLIPTFKVAIKNSTIRGRYIKVECPNVNGDMFYIYANTQYGDLNDANFIHHLGIEMLSHFEEWWPKTKNRDNSLKGSENR